MKKRKNIKLFVLSGLATIALVSIPSAIVACSSKDTQPNDSLQTTLNKYIETVNTTILSATSEVNSSTSASQVNSSNISTYVSGIPAAPAEVKLSYQISPDTFSGTISLVINASAVGVVAKNSKPQIISGFQNATELFVLEANKVLNKLSPNELGTQTLVTDLALDPSDKNYKSIDSLLNTSILPSSEGLSLSYIVTSVDSSTGSATFYIIVFQKGFSKQTNPVTVTGFATPLLNQIKNLNLTANGSFAPPQNTNNFVPFANSGSIFANFNMTEAQINFLKSISNLNIMVSDSSLLTGQATLTFFHNDNGNYNSIGQITYNNFFKGTSTAAQVSVETYLKNNDNVATWLNSYLHISPSWLNNIFTKHLNGGFFLGYNFSSDRSQMTFNNIVVSNVDNVITINAIMPNPMSYEKWNDDTSQFVPDGTTLANQAVTIQLPFLFQTNGDANTQIIPSINTSGTGQTTIAWAIPGEGISGSNIKYFFKFNNISMGFRLASVNSIDSIVF